STLPCVAALRFAPKLVAVIVTLSVPAWLMLSGWFCTLTLKLVFEGALKTPAKRAVRAGRGSHARGSVRSRFVLPFVSPLRVWNWELVGTPPPAMPGSGGGGLDTGRATGIRQMEKWLYS